MMEIGPKYEMHLSDLTLSCNVHWETSWRNFHWSSCSQYNVTRYCENKAEKAKSTWVQIYLPVFWGLWSIWTSNKRRIKMTMCELAEVLTKVQKFSQFSFLIPVCGLSWLYLIKLARSCLRREITNKVWAKWARTKVKKWEIQVSNFHALNYCCKLCRKTSTLMKLDESSI